MANPAKSQLRAARFGSFPTDPNHKDLSVDGNYFMTIDATGTPQVSPLSTSSTGVTLAVPAAAFRLRITNTDQILHVSEDPAFASYVTIPVGGSETFPCATPNMDNATANTGSIYMKAASTTANVSFRFDCI